MARVENSRATPNFKGRYNQRVILPVFIAATIAAFAAVAGADPSEKAKLLSENISAVARIGSIGMLASLPPVVFAAVLFVRSRRFPASG